MSTPSSDRSATNSAILLVLLSRQRKIMKLAAPTEMRKKETRPTETPILNPLFELEVAAGAVEVCGQ